MKQNIIFFGSDNFTLPVLEKLLSHGITLVVTNVAHGKIAKFCKDNSVEILVTNLKDEESRNRIINSSATVAVLASYGAIIPQSIINSFKNGIINIHPSLLPKYKGPTPIPTTLLNGDTQTGVTLITLDKEVDHGPILSQKPYELQGNETSQDLLSILFEIGAEMVDAVITKLENDEELHSISQDHTKESWSYKISKDDGYIDISNIPAAELEVKNWRQEIDRKVRAYYPWPGVWFIARIKNQELRIKLLPENKIQVEGKNPVTYKDFVNGFGEEGRSLLSKLHLN